jgi:lysophosphatidate acyltransferase
MVDVLILGKLLPKRTSIMAKKSLQFTPLGPFMTMSGAIFIDRSNNASAVRSLVAAGQLMKSQQISLWVYPEGTRHMDKENTMLPLKKGGFHLAIQAGLPIVPVVAENYWKLYHKGVFETGRIKVKVLPPISTSGLTAADIPALTAQVYDQMSSTLREISSTPSSSPRSDKEKSTTKDRSPAGTSSSAPRPPALHALPKSDLGAGTVKPALIPSPPTPAGLSPGQRADSFASSEVSSPAWTATNLSSVASSENGAETEEDEGMVLVDRPESK